MPEPERGMDARIWAAAAVAVLLLLGIAAVATLHHAAARSGEVRTTDPYATNLSITGVTMSEATNGTGGKSMYIDGTLANTGKRVLTGALVQVTFATASGPQRETMPLTVVRTRVPYVDLESLSSAPLLPSEHRDFRFIFDSVPAAWDTKPPEIQVVHADLR